MASSSVYNVSTPQVISAVGSITIIGVTAQGFCTLTLNDCATTGAAAASNQIWQGFLYPGQGIPQLAGWDLNTGLVVSAINGTVAVSIT